MKVLGNRILLVYVRSLEKSSPVLEENIFISPVVSQNLLEKPIEVIEPKQAAGTSVASPAKIKHSEIVKDTPEFALKTTAPNQKFMNGKEPFPNVRTRIRSILSL